ncbi:MAG: hypothetical protein GIKADHBN_03699 [Phycisphaerales bacterium]|nr:hypothetical protein [Phycisphaerales bacterium]
MNRRRLGLPAMFIAVAAAPLSGQLVNVPTDIQQPGTQAQEVGNLESPDKCDNCHGGYNPAVEPAHNWRGSMMAHATRDPIFWATMAIAEQDFPGAGDLCIRCHSVDGWNAGRSVPTDGSSLTAADATGVPCDACHKMTNTSNTEWLGTMNGSFVANNGVGQGYYGSGMYSLWGGAQKLGPYADAQAKHQFGKSLFHRSSDLCGTCHDVSNPAVGDLAHNNGAPLPLTSGFSGVPGAPVDTKAAFNNFPFQYGVVERTFSEHKSSLLSQTRVSDYPSLPEDLRAGALRTAYLNAMASTASGNYVDGAARVFSCQTCHMPPVTGLGCNKAGTPVRSDLPLHDLTGGNTWIPDAIEYLDARGLLRLGGLMTPLEVAAMREGKQRAIAQLRDAATLAVDGNVLRVTNHTGHKLISGYPEGRRMWLNVRWFNAQDQIVREDGKYGPVAVLIGGTWTTVNSLIDLDDPFTKVYEAHYGMTRQWAQQLLALGYPASLELGYDRITGQPDATLGELAAGVFGESHETFHFVLNNVVIKDNRLPPYGFAYDAARVRNTLPVPPEQYGSPGPGGMYRYWDQLTLQPPASAVRADIRLLYQTTSWEYIQFLALANSGQVAFLAAEGDNLLDAWRNTGMAEPQVMATAQWVSLAPSEFSLVEPQDGAAGVSVTPHLEWTVSDGAATYTVTVDDDPLFNSPVLVQTGITATSFDVPEGVLATCSIYYWGVQAVNATASVASTPASFSFETYRPADFDGSGFVDIEDYSAFVAAFESGDESADFDSSGFVDLEDFTAFVAAFEAGC